MASLLTSCGSQGTVMALLPLTRKVLRAHPHHHDTNSSGAHPAVTSPIHTGNVCSMIHTANSDPWGSGLFVHGVALPNSASIQPYSIAAIPRGARLPGPLAHFMMLHQTSTGAAQRAVDLAVSVVGRSLHSCSLQLLRLLADFGGLVNVKVSMHTPVNSTSHPLTPRVLAGLLSTDCNRSAQV